METAEIILEQLGGRMFIAMTGAKNLVGDNAKLMFSIPRTENGINKVIIILAPNDTYTLEFWNIRGVKTKKIGEDSNIYNDNLREVFTKRTGLDCSL